MKKVHELRVVPLEHTTEAQALRFLEQNGLRSQLSRDRLSQILPKQQLNLLFEQQAIDLPNDMPDCIRRLIIDWSGGDQ